MSAEALGVERVAHSGCGMTPALRRRPHVEVYAQARRTAETHKKYT